MTKTLTIKVNGKAIETMTTTRDIKFAVVAKDNQNMINEAIERDNNTTDFGQEEIESIKYWESVRASGYAVVATSSRLDLAEKALATVAKRNTWTNLSITSEIE